MYSNKADLITARFVSVTNLTTTTLINAARLRLHQILILIKRRVIWQWKSVSQQGCLRTCGPGLSLGMRVPSVEKIEN